MSKVTVCLLLTLTSSGLNGLDCQNRASFLSLNLHCLGITSVSTSFTSSGPKIKKESSNDEMWITSSRGRLLVKINPQMYANLDEKTKHLLQQPDSYKIVGSTGEGIMAIYLPAETSERTLILKSDLREALLVETVFSFLPPQSEPESETIAFSCKGN